MYDSTTMYDWMMLKLNMMIHQTTMMMMMMIITTMIKSDGDPYGHPIHEVASLRIFGSRKSWAQRWNGLDE